MVRRIRDYDKTEGVAKEKGWGKRALRRRKRVAGDAWSTSCADAWTGIGWRRMRADLRKAQWDEAALMRLARSVSRRDMEELLWLWRELDDPRIQRLSRSGVTELLLEWQRTAHMPGHFDCAICGRAFPRGEHSIEHIVPRSELEMNSLDNHVLTCRGKDRCNQLRGAEYTLSGIRKVLVKDGVHVDEEKARRSLYRVRRMVVLITRMGMWVDVNLDEGME